MPAFEGTLRISQDVKVSSAAEFWGSLGKEGKTFTISGKLEYQACDQTICYLPTSVPLQMANPSISLGSHARADGNSP